MRKRSLAQILSTLIPFAEARIEERREKGDVLPYAILLEDIRQAKSMLSRLDDEKNFHAMELGGLGGEVGGPARARSLSPQRRRAIAQAAAQKRWAMRRP